MVRRLPLSGLTALVWAVMGMVSLWAPAGTAWELPYGAGKGQVGFLNHKVRQIFEEASPLGPLAFRVFREQAWVLDSLQSRILVLDANGRLAQTIVIPGLASNTLLEDLALVPGPDGRVESVWIGDGADARLRRVRVADGTVMAEAGGAGDAPGQLRQIHQIEASPAGEVWVGDLGRGRLIRFDGEGKWRCELPWSGSGFALHPHGGVSTLSFSEKVGYLWRTFNQEGRLQQVVHLGWADHLNPRIWGLTAEGGLIVSFVPPGGFRGWLRLVVFHPSGRSGVPLQVVPPLAMNRFLDFDPGPWPAASVPKGWLARGDFERAPEGRFVIERWPKEVRP
jgi:hypothetical protein